MSDFDGVTNDYDGLMGHLSDPKSREDWVAVSALADWLEEQGRQFYSDCMRWCADNHKRPYVTERVPGKASWFDADTIAKGLLDESSDLPGGLYKALTDYENRVASHSTYGSVKAAFEALMKAWEVNGGDISSTKVTEDSPQPESEGETSK